MPEDQVKTLIAELRKEHTKALQNAAISIQADLVEVNPKDTGWSASNWLFGVGKSPSAVGNKLDRKKALSPQLGRARSRQQNSLRKLFTMIIPESVFISNHVSYVPILDERGSPKRGLKPRWVRRAITTGLQKIGQRARVVSEGGSSIK